MLAYHNDQSIKTKLLTDLAEHAAADRIVQGRYWECGKGCAVACTLHAFDLEAAKRGTHAAYETVFGIPRALARLEDRIFESLTNGKAKEWPQRFASAIPPGADLAMVVPKFLFWILSERLPQFIDKEERPKVWQAVADITELYREWCEGGTKPSRERFVEARANVYATYAADAADAAAAYAAYTYAADAADAAAAYAAYTYAADAADAAAAAAAAAAAYRDSLASAHSAEVERQADQLIELLAAAPVKAPEVQAA